MKTQIKFIFAATVLLLLAGCSIVPSSTDGGFLRSDNGGENFQQKVTIDEKTRISSVDVLSLAVNPQNGNEVYIGTRANGIFKTTDAGEKWQIVKVSEAQITKVYSIAVDPMNTNTVYVAAIVGDRGKILKSVDSGATWTEVHTEPSSGSFILALALDPLDPRKIYAGTTGGQIFRSDNGGDTWSNLYQAASEIFKIEIDNFNSNLVYFAVFQGGMIRTKDGGQTFEDRANLNAFGGGSGIGNATEIAADPNRENWVYAGTGEGLHRSKDGGDTWELIKILNKPRENSIMGIAINPINSDEIIYGAAQAFYKSVDGGQSWATTQLGGNRTIETVAYSRQNPGVIYAGMNKR